jgi:hypothetical protein
MNIRRGMFRFWVLFAAVWFVGCAVLACGELTLTLPSLTYGLSGAMEDFHLVDSWSRDDLEKTYQKIDMGNEVTILAHPAIPEEVLRVRLATFDQEYIARRPSELWQRRLAALPVLIGIAIFVPASVLGIGAALGWALVGFKK